MFFFFFIEICTTKQGLKGLATWTRLHNLAQNQCKPDTRETIWALLSIKNTCLGGRKRTNGLREQP
jgi:hypothetical protein